MRKLLIVVIAFMAGTIFAQVQDINTALQNGDITLTASGTGGSSGAAIDGYLQNRLPRIIRINIIIPGGLYLRNSGSAQNMVATQVYFEGGSYYSEDGELFIELEPKSRTPVLFIAFCADFELDNPSPEDSFTRGAMPPDLADVSAKASGYMADHPGEDMVTAVQLAFWLSRGETIDSISKKFDFLPDDADLARRIMEYAP
jgi:hypothetical protein